MMNFHPESLDLPELANGAFFPVILRSVFATPPSRSGRVARAGLERNIIWLNIHSLTLFPIFNPPHHAGRAERFLVP